MRRDNLLALATATLLGLSGCGGGYDAGGGGADVGDATTPSEGAGGGSRAESEPSREEAQRTVENLKRIVLALHNHHDTHKCFPVAAARGPNGEQLLSWRVALLPFLGEQELYNEFRQDEPWDSDHNKGLVGRMPEAYRSMGSRGDGTTSYLVFTGEGAPFGGDKALRMADVLDGTSNTLFCVEAGPDRAVPWTKPEDLPFQPDTSAAVLGQHAGEHIPAAMFDGSLRFIPKDIDPRTLRALITHSGGELVAPDAFQ
jgi:hypothetical protein